MRHTTAPKGEWVITQRPWLAETAPQAAADACVFAVPEGLAIVLRSDPLGMLAMQALDGSRRAQRILVQRLSPRMRRVIARVLRSKPDIEDALQDSLVGFFGSLPNFRGESSVAHFAQCLAMRCALTVRRRLMRECSNREQTAEWRQPWVQAPQPPDQTCLDALRRRALIGLLQELPEAQNQAVLLRVLGDKSLQEIATIAHVPLNTVRTRLRLARARLRLLIESTPRLQQLLRLH